MQDALILGLVVAALVFSALAAMRKLRRFLEARRRAFLRSKIRSLADDLSTELGALTFEEVTLLPVDLLEEIHHELSRMPKGERDLRRAMAITGKVGYVRSA